MLAPWTAVHNTPNKSPRQNVPRKGVVLHHAAMTSLDGLRRLAMGAKQVSATAICKDNHIELLIPDDYYRPWSLSSGYWDSALRSVETANESTDGWTISDASHWSLARAVAYWAEKDGFYPHRNGAAETWTVIGHREVYQIHDASYATACPGGLDLNLVTRRAQQLLAGTRPAGDDITIIDESEEDEMKPFIIHKVNSNGSRQWALISGDLSEMVPIWKVETANGLALNFGPSTLVVDAEWQGFVSASKVDITLLNPPAV